MLNIFSKILIVGGCLLSYSVFANPLNTPGIIPGIPAGVNIAGNSVMGAGGLYVINRARQNRSKDFPGQQGLINHKYGVALDGYDVVAYFQNYENGIKDEGRKGSKKISSKYKAVTYYFSTQENKNLFDQNPANYLPAYGGWCAWAMANGESRVSVNYDTFLIAPDENGKNRLYLFYNTWLNNTLNKWLDGDHNELVLNANKTWTAELEKKDKNQE